LSCPEEKESICLGDAVIIVLSILIFGKLFFARKADTVLPKLFSRLIWLSVRENIVAIRRPVAHLFMQFIKSIGQFIIFDGIHNCTTYHANAGYVVQLCGDVPFPAGSTTFFPMFKTMFYA